MNKGEKSCCYKILQCNKIVEFEIVNNISEDVTLDKLMVTVGHVNHTVSIYVCWINYYDYKRALPLVK